MIHEHTQGVPSQVVYPSWNMLTLVVATSWWIPSGSARYCAESSYVECWANRKWGKDRCSTCWFLPFRSFRPWHSRHMATRCRNWCSVNKCGWHSAGRAEAYRKRGGKCGYDMDSCKGGVFSARQTKGENLKVPSLWNERWKVFSRVDVARQLADKNP